MTDFAMYSYYMVSSQTYVKIEQTSQCSSQWNIKSTHLMCICGTCDRSMNTDGWSQKTQSICLPLWLILTENQFPLDWLTTLSVFRSPLFYFRIYALGFKLGLLQINHTGGDFSSKQSFLWL